MPEYLSPGVYVEELDRGSKSIEAAGTAMPVFVGFSEKAERTRTIDGEPITENLLNRAQLVTSWTQYRESFGNMIEGAYMPHSVYGYFLNGGSRCYVMSVKTIPRAETALPNAQDKPQLIARARRAGLDGLRLRVRVDVKPSLTAPAAKPAGSKKAAAKKGSDGEADADTPAPASGGGAPAESFTITVERQGQNSSWISKESFRNLKLAETQRADGTTMVEVVYPNSARPQLIELVVPDTVTALAQAWPRQNEGEVLKIQNQLVPPATYADFQGDVTKRAGVDGLADLDDATMLVIPDIMSTMPGQKRDQAFMDNVKAVQSLMIAHCEQMGDRVAILDAPPDMTPQEVNNWRMDTAGYDTSYAALYYPWIEIMDPVTNRPIKIPPSGHMAGVWARTDNTRGVHKAPANEVVQGAIGVGYKVAKGEQDVLNPNQVNCIRVFPGEGIKVWGARTLSGSNPSWKYINVRRFFNMVEKSIEDSTSWTVFEPNDERLWAQIRRDVSAFLSIQWRNGALFGATPDQAYFVKCDAELNPKEIRDAGQVIIEVGMAPVTPAEFVIFRVFQWSPEQ
ncbi:MAG: phage tail sheath subtilisin-like domain-containing protein [Chloroflexota bacterium]